MQSKKGKSEETSAWTLLCNVRTVGVFFNWKVFFLILAAMFFSLGLWAIDTGATAALCNKSFDVGKAYVCSVEGLFYTNREPRIQYHIGIVVTAMSFLSICALSLFSKKNN
jgi:hypothetical protein